MSAIPHPMQNWAEANKPRLDAIALYPSRITMSIRAWLRLPPIPLIYTTPEELKRGAEKVERSDAAIKVMAGEMSIEDFQKQFPFPIQPGASK
ncbi:MAG: hypothetical protein E6Q97_36825 [Desulfurellales bacterium]|nr:MAG: hypothetical protein E6Q97_36825 [Desulfurellales bacterium]